MREMDTGRSEGMDLFDTGMEFFEDWELEMLADVNRAHRTRCRSQVMQTYRLGYEHGPAQDLVRDGKQDCPHLTGGT